MITFWVDRENQFTFRNYLEGRGQPIRDHFVVRPYEWTAERLEVVAGPQIFAGLDQLTEPEREAVALLRDLLAGLLPGRPLLNDPRRSLLRPALLTLLADQGLNRFRVHSGQEAERVTRFPVYLRDPLDHGGNLTPLLHSPGELRRALAGLRLRGHRRKELLIVEFCDTRDAAGIFRKYSVHRVGSRMIPAHLMCGPHWMLKSETAERTLAMAHEDHAFTEANPHREWLERVFDLAGIEYGRIDYGVLDGQPQAWEINLNPTIGRQSGKPPRDLSPEVTELWKRTREHSHARLRDAFVALEAAADRTETVTVRLPAELLVRIRKAVGKRRRRRATLNLLKRAYHSPLGLPFRALLPRI